MVRLAVILHNLFGGHLYEYVCPPLEDGKVDVS